MKNYSIVSLILFLTANSISVVAMSAPESEKNKSEHVQSYIEKVAHVQSVLGCSLSHYNVYFKQRKEQAAIVYGDILKRLREERDSFNNDFLQDESLVRNYLQHPTTFELLAVAQRGKAFAEKLEGEHLFTSASHDTSTVVLIIGNDRLLSPVIASIHSLLQMAIDKAKEKKCL